MDVEEYEVNYAMAVMALVGEQNFIGGPTHGPIDKINLKDGISAPTEEAIQAKLTELQNAEQCEFCEKKEPANLLKLIGDQALI